MVSHHQIDENFYEIRSIYYDLDKLVMYYFCKSVNYHKSVFHDKDGVIYFAS